MENSIWSELSEESKGKVLEAYKLAKDYNSAYPDSHFAKGEISALDRLFGKENLNLNLKPQIKTWDDVIKNTVTPNNDSNVSDVFDNYVIVRDVIECPDIIKRKLEATYRIAVLIELGYGGMITDEEWNNEEIQKYCIHWSNSLKSFYYDVTFGDRELLAFHTPEQQRSFFENNEQLCKDYFMV